MVYFLRPLQTLKVLNRLEEYISDKKFWWGAYQTWPFPFPRETEASYGYYWLRVYLEPESLSHALQKNNHNMLNANISERDYELIKFLTQIYSF